MRYLHASDNLAVIGPLHIEETRKALRELNPVLDEIDKVARYEPGVVSELSRHLRPQDLCKTYQSS